MTIWYNTATGMMTLKDDDETTTWEDQGLVFVASLDMDDPDYEPHTITLDDDCGVVSTLEDK